jgi:hypothetical protein
MLNRRQRLSVTIVVGVLGVGAAINACTGSPPLDAGNASPSTTSPLPRPSPTTASPAPAPTPTPTPTTASPTQQPSPTPNPREREASAQLASLKVTNRVNPSSTYQRDAFGTSWVDTDHNGCNQRDDVLLRDAVPRTVKTGWQGSCDHDVLAGTWIDPYTGRRVVLTDAKDRSQSMAVQIDHVVPLNEAWVSGASEWSYDRRRVFANDLSNLLAVDGPTNESKGDDDPAAWRPRKGFQCPYAVRWIRVKARWGLTVDTSEVRALHEMLDYC